MAYFVTNSTGTHAVRKSSVIGLEIGQISPGNPPSVSYNLWVRTEAIRYAEVVFESDLTLEGIQAKAATVLAALEE